MQMSKKIIKKSLITSPCDWLVWHYSFNLPFALKSIALYLMPVQSGWQLHYCCVSLSELVLLYYSLILTHFMIIS